MEKLLSGRDASGVCLHEVVAALRMIIKDRDEKTDKAADMSNKAMRVHEETRSMVVSLRAVEVSEHQRKIDTLKDEVKAKDLVL